MFRKIGVIAAGIFLAASLVFGAAGDVDNQNGVNLSDARMRTVIKLS
jgi:hypothetical protein